MALTHIQAQNLLAQIQTEMPGIVAKVAADHDDQVPWIYVQCSGLHDGRVHIYSWDVNSQDEWPPIKRAITDVMRDIQPLDQMGDQHFIYV